MSTNYRINYFNQIKSFYSFIYNTDFEIRPVHISLYMFLLNQNNRSNWIEWFKCPYDLAMQGACINSKNTYYKCLDDLQSFNLIEYKKGINLYKSPKIKILEFTIPNTGTLTEPLTVQVTVPLCGKLTEPLTEPLTELLNENIYKLITDNYKTINEKLETWLESESLIPKKQKIDFEEIVKIFNSVCVDLPVVEKISKTREKAIENRIKEFSLEQLGDVFRKVHESDFLSGRKTDWKANFDWIMNPTNFIKILEDTYKNNTANGTSKSNEQIFTDAMQSPIAKYDFFK